MTTVTGTLSSSAQVGAMFHKATLLSDIYKAFYNLITNKCTDPVGKVRFVYGTFPDLLINEPTNKSLYPFVIINSANLSWDDWLFKKKMASGSIVIEVYSAKNSLADQVADDVINQIELQRDELWGAGLRNVMLQSVDSDHIMRGKDSIHTRAINFSFKYPIGTSL